MPLIQIKMTNLLAFLLLILDVFHKPIECHCVFIPLLSVFKQADDYKDDDNDDGNDDSGLRRSSCRVERDAHNRPVYSRKGTLRMFKMAAAGWQLTQSADVLMYRCENTLTERWSLHQVGGGVGWGVASLWTRKRKGLLKKGLLKRGTNLRLLSSSRPFPGFLLWWLWHFQTYLSSRCWEAPCGSAAARGPKRLMHPGSEKQPAVSLLMFINLLPSIYPILPPSLCPSKKESPGDKKHSGGKTSAQKCHSSQERLRSSTTGALARDRMR